MDWYIPPHVTQRTGTKCQFSNCWCAVGSWHHRAATGGTASVTPEEFRIAAGGGSGKPNPDTGCITGFETDIVKGLNKLGVKASIVKLTSALALKVLTTERRAVFGIALDYDAYPANRDCMNGEAGPDVNHMIGFIGGKPLKMVMNPLCQDYQSVPALAILKAAEKFSLQSGRVNKDGKPVIWMTKVLRPVPDDTSVNESLIEELYAQIEERDDAINEALGYMAEAMSALAPYKE